MIRSITLRNYRCFEDSQIHRIGQRNSATLEKLLNGFLTYLGTHWKAEWHLSMGKSLFLLLING